MLEPSQSIDENNEWNDTNQASGAMLEVVYNKTKQLSYLIYVTSTPVTPQRLALAELRVSEDIESFSFEVKKIWQSPFDTRFFSISSKTAKSQTVSEVENTRKKLGSMRWRVLSIYAKSTPDHANVNNADRYEGILILPPIPTSARDTSTDTSPDKTSISTNLSIPLIVVPHGGPHSVMPTQFVPAYAFLSMQLNAAVLHVNYRGSSGFGQTSIDSLLGNIGISISLFYLFIHNNLSLMKC
jgi:dipeptidyl aminopeptidase/acylaminoacyl peptidase